jgi:hypothetical protein
MAAKKDVTTTGGVAMGIKQKIAEQRVRAARLEGPFTAISAAVTLVGLCDEIDVTYVDPIPADADDRRKALRADIATLGERIHAQGGEDFMLEVATLVASASAHGNYLSREWSGIGSWLG